MKQNKKLDVALDGLADHIENGHLLAATNPADFINLATQRLIELKVVSKIAHIYLNLRYCKHCGTINNSGFVCINENCAHPEDP